MRRSVAFLAAIALLAACGGGDGEATTTTGSAAETTTAPAEPTTSEATPETTEAPAEALVLYSGRNENFVEPVIEAFTAETGIEVDARYAGTGELATTILAEGDDTPADVFWAQDPAFIGGIAKEGLLTELPTDIVDLVDERFRDADGQWVGITARSRVFVYNTDLVADDELPATVWDLVEPEWNGRFGVAPTNGSFVAFVSGMLLAEGEERTREWLEGIAANDPVIFEGNGPIVDATVAGDLPGGLVNHYYLLQRIAELGEVPAANHYFGDDDPGAMVMATGAGILASSDQPDAAADLIRYLLAAESQEHFLGLFEYPLIDGAGTPEGQPPLDELPVFDVDLTDTADTLEPALTLISESGLN
ncbi:MAG TPA: iron ABC transporter substrate-binding protein [Acidimicrobiia bacterium]|nr:iron ABC transporter substrate-binding protein [Acidimicrobiia bacterium]